jgi:hypothetical protein
MEQRYHMRTIDGTSFIEHKLSVMGKQMMEGLRRGRPDLFRGQRIKEVLQAHPEQVKCGVLHNYT